MRLTERDRRILEAIHSHDGILSISQIERLFFTGSSQAKHRMMLLYQHGYVNRPGRYDRRKIPDMIYWLDRVGEQLVAAMNNVTPAELKALKEPRWFQVEHDLAVNEFRIALSEACRAHAEIDLQTWVPEREFWRQPDRIEYELQGKRLERNIRPDGFFLLTTPKHKIRYLLEIDRGTEDNPRFLREKIAPGLAYIRSEAFAERFGYSSGRWLVVTTGERRMRNMLRQARRARTKGLFYFTTYDLVTPESVLRDPIWQREDRPEPVPMVFLD